MYRFGASCKYMQYIANDYLQLEGDVVRVFQGVFAHGGDISLDEIVLLPVDFYCITYVSNCVKIGSWEKIGNSPLIGDLKDARFRCANDFGSLLNGEPIKVSNDWYVWVTGDSSTTHIGPLIEPWRGAHIGDLLPPAFINERMENGEYNFIYPVPQ